LARNPQWLNNLLQSENYALAEDLKEINSAFISQNKFKTISAFIDGKSYYLTKLKNCVAVIDEEYSEMSDFRPIP